MRDTEKHDDEYDDRVKQHSKRRFTFSIASLALMPRGVFAATAALNISPVAKWHKQYSSLIIGDWVPFPEPGGPAGKFATIVRSPSLLRHSKIVSEEKQAELIAIKTKHNV